MKNKEEKIIPEKQNITEQKETTEITETNTDKQEQTQPEKKKNNKKKGIIIAIVTVVIIVAAIISYFVFLKPEPKETTTKTPTKEVKSEYRMTGNDLQEFDLYFLKLENAEKNKVYSPLSIKYALAMLSEGAKGETKQQIDAVIGDYKAKKYPNNEHMTFANAMFIKDTYKDAIKPEYTNILKDKYNAEVITDSFETPNNINNWVSNKTFKLINNLLDDASKNDYFLINALAIDMAWTNQIHCAHSTKQTVPCHNNGSYSIRYDHEKIEEDATMAYSRTSYPYFDENEFYHLDFNGNKNTKASEILADFNRYDIIKELGEDNIRKTVTEEYKKWLQGDGQFYINDPETADVEKNVNRYIEEIKSNYGKAEYSSDFKLYTDDNVKVFAKDLQEYNGTTLQYVGIMPTQKDLTEYVKEVKATELNNIISNLKELKIENFKDGVATIITGDIPLFKYDYELQLMDDLKKLGIKNVFDINKADLSNLTTGTTAITKAVHKANIEFSNEGIKAAAATAVGGAGATSGGFEYLYQIPVEKIDLTFNKPYMYIIRDKDTGEVWFTGTVYEPIKK